MKKVLSDPRILYMKILHLETLNSPRTVASQPTAVCCTKVGLSTLLH